ncbi:internal virion protein with endolysin domain [Vibrio phage D530]
MPNTYLDFIKEKEGFHPTAYKDNTQYSIGYGTRTEIPEEIAGTVSISQEEAQKRLSDWTTKDRAYIQEAGEREGLEWTPHELDALTSFTYNLGRGNLDTLIDDRDKATIAEKMKLYNKSDGEVLEGLTTRRMEESQMFTTPVEESEPAEVADRSYLDYTEQHIPMSVLRSTPTAVEGEAPTAGELWEAAKYRNWIDNSMTRNAEINSDTWERDYRVDTADLVKYNDQGYTEQEIGFLSEASSEVNFAHRVERIAADRKVKQVIEQGGMTGTGMEMLAGIADPSLIPTFFLGGTAAAAGKWNSAKAIGLSLLSGASQNVAAEYLLKMGDTQRTDEDLMLAASAGALFSGTITAGALGYRSARTRIAQANHIEAAHIDGVNTAMDGVAYNKADSSIAADIQKAANRKRVLTEKDIIRTLQEETGTRADALSSKKIKRVKQSFREYRKGQVAKIEKIRNSKMRPSAKLKQIKQLEDSIARRELELNDAIAMNNDKLSTNSNLDALQQGKIPDSLKSRYDELKREAGEYDTEVPTKLKGEAPEPRVEREASTEMEGDEGGMSGFGSVGAMRVRSLLKFVGSKSGLLAESEVEGVQSALETAAILGVNTPRVSRMASKAKGFRSMSTIVDSAPDAATRGIGIQVLKNGTRTIEGHQSAEEVAETLFFRNTPDYMVHEAAFDEYAKQQGLGFFQNKQAAKQEFDKQVVLLQSTHTLDNNKHVETDDPIMKAAKARARIYERSLKNNKDYEVVGFENVEHSNSYHSVVYNAENILEGASATNADAVIDCIANSYMNGGIKLTRENAERLAETQVSRTFSYRNGTNGTFKKTMSDEEFKLLGKEMKEKGVDATTIEELKNSLFNKEELAHLSPRAMFSLKPDLKATSGDLRMVDLIDTSMDRVMKYASDSSGNAGLAAHGYKSRMQFQAALEAARTQSINDLNAYTYSDTAKEALRKRQLARAEQGKDQQLIEDAVKLMYREPLTQAPDAVEDLSKLLRKQTSITRLRSTGLMSIPENAIAMARNGALNTLQQLPHARYFDLRSRSITQDKFMNDFARTFSATGHQEYLFGAKFYNNSDFDDVTKSRLGNIINNAQGKAMNVTMTVNAFRTFQHGGEEMVARSIVSNLKELAVKGSITPNIRKSLVKVGGLSEDQVDEMAKHFVANPDVDVFDSVRMMPPELYNAVSIAARNTIGSSFMRMGIGESVPYANRELGKVITSLLNFSIGSWEKMVVRGVKSDGVGLMASMFAGQSALALMSQYAYVYSRAAAMDEQKRAKYIEKNLNDEGLFWGVFNRVGFLAAPSIPLQMLAAARLLPEQLSATPTKAGISPTGLPSVSMGSDLLKSAGSAGDLIANQFNDEYMSDRDREKNWRNIRRVLPWLDSPVYNFTVGQLD